MDGGLIKELNSQAFILGVEIKRNPELRPRVATIYWGTTLITIFFPMKRRFETLIRAKELATLLKGSSKVHVLEAGIDSFAAYKMFRIPSAKYFDIAKIARPDCPTPPMLPSEQDFNTHMQNLGIPNDASQIVCYDRGGLLFASRVWWTFKAFGRNQVAVLDGGLPAWIVEGHETSEGEEAAQPSTAGQPYVFDKKVCKSLGEMVVFEQLLRLNPPQTLTQVLDTRAPGTFMGRDSFEKTSHINGAKNLYFKRLLTEDGNLKSPELLEKEFKSVGINLSNDRHTINTCIAGVSACLSFLAMHHIGKTNCSVYDGSWNEYSNFLKIQEEDAQNTKR